MEQVYIKGDKGSIVLTSVGQEAVLTTLAWQEAKLGLIFLEMRRAVEDIVKDDRMKKKNTLFAIKNAIPGGEGLIALPTAFVCKGVIARKPQADVAIRICIHTRDCHTVRMQCGRSPALAAQVQVLLARNDIISMR